MTEYTTEEMALRAMDQEVSRLTWALEIIAGRKPPIDYLLGNADIAIAALDKKWPFGVLHNDPQPAQETQRDED